MVEGVCLSLRGLLFHCIAGASYAVEGLGRCSFRRATFSWVKWIFEVLARNVAGSRKIRARDLDRNSRACRESQGFDG